MLLHALLSRTECMTAGTCWQLLVLLLLLPHLVIINPHHEEQGCVPPVDHLVAAVLKDGALQTKHRTAAHMHVNRCRCSTNTDTTKQCSTLQLTCLHHLISQAVLSTLLQHSTTYLSICAG